MITLHIADNFEFCGYAEIHHIDITFQTIVNIICEYIVLDQAHTLAQIHITHTHTDTRMHTTQMDLQCHSAHISNMPNCGLIPCPVCECMRACLFVFVLF